MLGARCIAVARFVDNRWLTPGHLPKKLFTLLDLCVSSLRRGHANLLCIVPILTDDPRRESNESMASKCMCWLPVVRSDVGSSATGLRRGSLRIGIQTVGTQFEFPIQCKYNKVDTLGFEPRAFRMRSGCDTTTPCARLADSSG